MSTNGNTTVQDPLKKRRVIVPRGPAVEESFVVVNHDWFVPVPLLRRLNSAGTENELESIAFPQDESFDSQWQFYLEHQTHPPRIRIGLVFLAPRDRCLRADVKLILITTHGGQVIKESVFYDHTFFLAKGEPTASFINDHISPKLFLDVESELYQDVISKTKQGTPFNTDDCTILAYVRFINELEIQPKTKAFDSSRRFTVDWKLTKFHQIIEQINQSRPPVGNDRRFVSDRFQFTHVKIVEGVKSKKWRLLIKCPNMQSNPRQTPLYLTIKCSDFIHANYGKIELICKNEHNVLRRYTQSFEDLADNYTMEFFNLDELSTNIYSYRHDYNETNGRFFTIEYLLFSIQIVQPLQRANVPKNIKRVVEPTIISLNSNGNIQSRGTSHMIKSSREHPMSSLAKHDSKRVSSVLKTNEKAKSPEQHGITRENTTGIMPENPITSWDPFSGEPRGNSLFPPIGSRNQNVRPSPERINHSPIRHQPSAELHTLPSIQENLFHSPRLFQNKQLRFAPQSRLRSFDRYNNNPPALSGSSIATTASSSSSFEIPDNFVFLKNLYQSGLHSDVTIRCRDRQWNLHKSILSARSIYFNQYFASSNESDVELSNDDETPPSNILEKIFIFLYTNQYVSLSSPSQTPSPAAEIKRRRRSSSSTATITATTANSSFDTIRLVFLGAVKYGIDALCLLCLQDMCNAQNLNISTAAVLLICLHQAQTGLYETYHSNDYIAQIKNFKQAILRFIQFHSREVLLSSQWKLLEKRYPFLVHDVLQFVVFEKIEE